MNKIIKQLKNRRSVREFTGEKVKDEDLKLILETAQRYPNGIHVQDNSLIVIKNKETIKKIAELSGNQKQVENADVFILILIDYYRAVYAAESKGKKIFAPTSAAGIIAGSVDAGILLNTIQTVAESLGYGTTAIGGLMMNPDEIIKLFNLPKHVFPLIGTTIGVPTENKLKSLKPRVPFESFAFKENYDSKKVEDGVEIFDEEFRKWWDENNLNQMPSYKDSIIDYYKSIVMNKINSTLEKQGFKFTDSEK